MKKALSLGSVLLIASILFIGCQKDLPPPNFRFTSKPDQIAQLNPLQKETVRKFQHASYVLQKLFAEKELREEFNSFISAKLKKTLTDEELQFKEIFNARTLNLEGVKPDFLKRFKGVFLKTIISNDFPNGDQFLDLSLNTEAEVASYFGLKKVVKNRDLNNTRPGDFIEMYEYDENEIPYEIYYPYSENFPENGDQDYTITYNPLYTDESNMGFLLSSIEGNPLYEVTVNDDYAYGAPTYIITYDDGLQLSDFENGKMPVEALTYNIGVSDDYYNPIRITGGPIMGGVPNPSPCTRELRVKDGRWTLLNNGYGIFEGKIEYAVAVSNDVTEVIIPNQYPATNPIISLEKKVHAWGYEKIKRKKVKDMGKDKYKYISFNLNVSPWCPEQPDKMIFLYEYDKPNWFSSNAKELSEVISSAVSLIGDAALRGQVSTFASEGLAPLVKVLLEGTAKSNIEHFSIIGSNAVWTNQKNPSAGTDPSLLNGFRLYGKNSVNATLVVD